MRVRAMYARVQYPPLDLSVFAFFVIFLLSYTSALGFIYCVACLCVLFVLAILILSGCIFICPLFFQVSSFPHSLYLC